jgi:hypothetical protein
MFGRRKEIFIGGGLAARSSAHHLPINTRERSSGCP